MPTQFRKQFNEDVSLRMPRGFGPRLVTQDRNQLAALTSVVWDVGKRRPDLTVYRLTVYYEIIRRR